MQKYVLKISIISVLGLFVVALLSYFFIALLSPATLARFYEKVGSYKKAVVYYDSEYEKTGEIKDLCALCDSALKTGDNGLIAEHLQKLSDDESFYSYCQEKENGLEYYELITSKYLQSQYEISGLTSQEIVEKALNYSKTYTTTCAFRSVMFIAVEKEDSEFLTKVLSALKEKDVLSMTETERTILSSDIKNLENFLN